MWFTTVDDSSRIKWSESSRKEGRRSRSRKAKGKGEEKEEWRMRGVEGNVVGTLLHRTCTIVS